MYVSDLPTPALCVDVAAFHHNIDVMSASRPGSSLRPHVKAFKSTAMATYVARRGGHESFCCATLKEVEGMVGLDASFDVLLANETLESERLAAVAVRAAESGPPVTVAIDSDETLDVAIVAARRAPVSVLIDINVGLPRCGCDPATGALLADRARVAGIDVRGVMGYEGHIVGNADRTVRVEELERSMAVLRDAHGRIGGDVISSGGTGTYDLHDWATEVQAGSYLLMDAAYAALGLPFRQALEVHATVLSVNDAGYAVANAGLKAFGMDHGEPTVVDRGMFFTSDEHCTFVWESGERPAVGDRVRMIPAHVDPTVACHEQMWLIDGDEVIERFGVDLRNW